MRFSPEVSEALTNLVTLENKVPQGSCCSSYIANLLFFNDEYNIVNKLKSKGIVYTRLLDDITISAEYDINDKEKTKIISMINGMVKKYRLSINTKKTKIEHSKDSKSELQVTGLWVKHKTPKLNKMDRRYIRYLVFICKKEAHVDRTSQNYHELWNRASGKVAQMTRLGHKQAKELRGILDEILPLYDEYKVGKIKLLANNYIRNFTPPLSDEQIKKVRRIIYDFDIIGRTNKNIAKIYRKKLKNLLPQESVLWNMVS